MTSSSWVRAPSPLYNAFETLLSSRFLLILGRHCEIWWTNNPLKEIAQHQAQSSVTFGPNYADKADCQTSWRIMTCISALGQFHRRLIEGPLMFLYWVVGLLRVAGVKVHHSPGTKVLCFLTFPRPPKLNNRLSVGLPKERKWAEKML